jgi:WD40 repeat protein
VQVNSSVLYISLTWFIFSVLWHPTGDTSTVVGFADNHIILWDINTTSSTAKVMSQKETFIFPKIKNTLKPITSSQVNCTTSDVYNVGTVSLIHVWEIRVWITAKVMSTQSDNHIILWDINTTSSTAEVMSTQSY